MNKINKLAEDLLAEIQRFHTHYEIEIIADSEIDLLVTLLKNLIPLGNYTTSDIRNEYHYYAAEKKYLEAEAPEFMEAEIDELQDRLDTLEKALRNRGETI